MINFLTKIITVLGKFRLSLIFMKRRKHCQCLCDMCTKEDCPAKSDPGSLHIN